MKEHLFAYGTLLPEIVTGKLARIVSQLSYLGKAHVFGKLYKLKHYPTLVQDNSQTKVFGKVFEFPEDDSFLLRALDKYEGYEARDLANSLFVRKKTTATLESGEELECWLYVYNQSLEGAVQIQSGDYLAFLFGQEDAKHIPVQETAKQCCCEKMNTELNRKCHEHAEDPFACPEHLVYYSNETKQYGLIIHDGKNSFTEITFCPWCGTKLQ